MWNYFEILNSFKFCGNHNLFTRIFSFKLLFIVIFDAFLNCSSLKLDDIYWNSSNTMFEISNTEHVKQVELLDRVTILCPQPTILPQRYEYTKLYVVSREGYENCELLDEKQLGVCITPERQSSISVVFRDFSPLSSSLQFKAGQSYYVISTSDGTYAGINRGSGGLCLTKNMKMKFDVRKEAQKSGPMLMESTALFSILPPFNNDSTSPPILYIIHTSEPDSSSSIASTISDSIRSMVFDNRNSFSNNNRQQREKFLASDTNASMSPFTQSNKLLICFGILIAILKMCASTGV